jgi:hypothetical protein
MANAIERASKGSESGIPSGIQGQNPCGVQGAAHEADVCLYFSILLSCVARIFFIFKVFRRPALISRALSDMHVLFF